MSIFEKQYVSKGFASQRKYPNESLLAFIGGNFGSLSPEERKKRKILELGCGSGANLWMIAREGYEAHGVDFAATGLDLCLQMLNSWGVSATLKQGDMTALPYESGYFDALVDIVSMQHLTFKQHAEAYREAFRCLKPGGLLYSFHLGENSISLKSTAPMLDHCTVENISEGLPLANNGQTCFLSANEARGMMAESGFEGVVVEKVTKSYLNQTQYVEYLSITAKKP